MKYDLVIFDLDGTTLNTLEDLADACNAALSANGYPTHSLEKIRLSVGSGVSRLIRLTLPESAGDETHAKVLADFKAYYAAHVDIKTKPYPGIISMLESMRAAGVHTAVNSNKFNAAVQALCSAHFGSLIEMALGECETVPKKPDPTGVQRIIARFHASPSRTLYVGDSDVDLRTAQNAGIDCAWVSWGFRRREELAGLAVPHAFDSADALTRFILD